jgi:hypothetical protein
MKPGPLAHAYNPSNSGSRDEEDHSSKPAQIVLKTLSWKYSTQKEAGQSDFKPQNCKPHPPKKDVNKKKKVEGERQWGQCT